MFDTFGEIDKLKITINEFVEMNDYIKLGKMLDLC